MDYVGHLKYFIYVGELMDVSNNKSHINIAKNCYNYSFY